MNNSRLFVLVLGSSFFLSGCVQTKQLGEGKSLLSISRDDAKKFLKHVGYPNNISAMISRSTTGDKLFIQFDGGTNTYITGVGYKVAIVSSNNIVMKDLPGEGFLNDEGNPVCWTTWLNRFGTPVHFANGYVLAPEVHWNGGSDGKFLSLWRENEDHWWIASIDSPIEKLVTFDRSKQFEFLISREDRLHVFVRGAPEGNPRTDHWYILKHYEYQLDGDKAHLLQVQDFYYTWTIMDFDPDSRLMFASSWDTMFAHGILINTVAGERKDVRGGSGPGYFLNAGVAKTFRDAIESRKEVRIEYSNGR